MKQELHRNNIYENDSSTTPLKVLQRHWRENNTFYQANKYL